jgi:hypothetical protein
MLNSKTVNKTDNKTVNKTINKTDNKTVKELVRENVEVGIMFASKAVVQVPTPTSDGDVPTATSQSFYGRNLRLFVITRVFFPGRPFRPSLMFAGKASSLT